MNAYDMEMQVVYREQSCALSMPQPKEDVERFSSCWASQCVSMTKKLTWGSFGLALIIGIILFYLGYLRKEAEGLWHTKSTFFKPNSLAAYLVYTEMTQRIDQFQLMRITTCSTTPSYYTPSFAQKIQHTIKAKELVYPAFKITALIFAPSRPLDVQKW